jgi:hypothetical protein
MCDPLPITIDAQCLIADLTEEVWHAMPQALCAGHSIKDTDPREFRRAYPCCDHVLP